MQLLQLDGPVSPPSREEQHATCMVARMAWGSRECVPFLRSELAKFILQKGFNWQEEPAGRKANPTHVYVFDGRHERIVAVGEQEDHEDIPVYRPFNAGIFGKEIDQLIDAGDVYVAVMADTFAKGVKLRLESPHH
jgi:hypothetical protein